MIAPILDEIADEYLIALKSASWISMQTRERHPNMAFAASQPYAVQKRQSGGHQGGALSKSQLQAFLDSNIWISLSKTPALCSF